MRIQVQLVPRSTPSFITISIGSFFSTHLASTIRIAKIDILKEISTQPSSICIQGQLLSGIIHFHRIIDNRMGEPAMKNPPYVLPIVRSQLFWPRLPGVDDVGLREAIRRRGTRARTRRNRRVLGKYLQDRKQGEATLKFVRVGFSDSTILYRTMTKTDNDWLFRRSFWRAGSWRIPAPDTK